MTAPATRRISLVLLAVWFGLITGISQLALRVGLSMTGERKVFDSPHLAWMTPLADVALFTTAALILALVLLRRPYLLRLRVSTFVFVLLVFWSAYVLYPRIHWLAAAILGLGIAVQAARWFSSHADALAPWIRRTTAVMATGVIVMAVGIWLYTRTVERRALAAHPPAPASSRNIVFIILDTVRAASMSLYGYTRPTTPNLEALAARSVVFDRAYATSPWTLPSHGSMFTGHPAHELSANWRVPLDGKYPTVAEVLRDNGYATAGFVANLMYGTSQFGLNRGFIHYADYTVTPLTIAKSSMLTRIVLARIRGLMGNHRDMARKTAHTVNQHFLDWLSDNGDRPFFAFLNYIDAHNPYTPPAPYDTRFGARKNQLDLSLQRRDWTPAQLQMEVDAYDGAIAYLDNELGLLIAELEKRGALDNTVIVIASDHGEHFGEHGLLYHANSLYLPLLHVPLVIMVPGGTAQRVSAPVTLAEMPATIMDLAGTTSAKSPFPGHSLARFWDERPDEPLNPTPLTASVRKTINMAAWLPASQGDMGSVIDGTWQLIRGGKGNVEFYDAVADPLGIRNVADSAAVQPDLRRMRAYLRAQLNEEVKTAERQ